MRLCLRLAKAMSFVGLLLVLTSCTLFSRPEPPLPEVHQLNILILGQSNATPSATWERFSEMLAEHQIGVYIINAARGGTRLMVEPKHWLPPNGEAFLEAMDLYEKHRLPWPRIDFIFWHQGEADAANLDFNWEETYSRGLNILFDELSTRIHGDWKAIAALISGPTNAKAGAVRGINAAIRKSVFFDRTIDLSDLELFDGTHFADPDLVGEKWAKAVLQELNLSSVNASGFDQRPVFRLPLIE